MSNTTLPAAAYKKMQRYVKANIHEIAKELVVRNRIGKFAKSSHHYPQAMQIMRGVGSATSMIDAVIHAECLKLVSQMEPDKQPTTQG